MSKQARYLKKILRTDVGRGLLTSLPKFHIPKVKRSIDVSEPKSRHFKYARRQDPMLTKAQWKLGRKPSTDLTIGPWVLSREQRIQTIGGKNKEFVSTLRIKVNPKGPPLSGLYYVTKVATIP